MMHPQTRRAKSPPALARRPSPSLSRSEAPGGSEDSGRGHGTGFASTTATLGGRLGHGRASGAAVGRADVREPDGGGKAKSSAPPRLPGVDLAVLDVPPSRSLAPSIQEADPAGPPAPHPEGASGMVGRKIIDIMNERMERGEKFFSFEYFPPKTEEVRHAEGPQGRDPHCDDPAMSCLGAGRRPTPPRARAGGRARKAGTGVAGLGRRLVGRAGPIPRSSERAGSLSGPPASRRCRAHSLFFPG